MTDAIFLSAGVPDPRRGPEFAKTADPIAISAAVAALVFVTLGRRRLVWGGQPAITPIVRAAAENLGLDFGSWVRLYQSQYFADEYPEENKLFRNVTYTPMVDGDRGASLWKMRETMFLENAFSAAVFIGGMGGVIEEFLLFRDLQPAADVVPVLSTGGATTEVARHLGPVDPALSDDLDYVSLLHRRLHVDVLERRYRTPEDQPHILSDRLHPPPVGAGSNPP